jgi:hypothetical protein
VPIPDSRQHLGQDADELPLGEIVVQLGTIGIETAVHLRFRRIPVQPAMSLFQSLPQDIEVSLGLRRSELGHHALRPRALSGLEHRAARLPTRAQEDENERCKVVRRFMVVSP